MSVALGKLEPYAGGERGGPGALLDAGLLETMRRYKLEVAKRYRVLAPEQVELAIPAGKTWCSTKLDGQLWFLVKREGEVLLCAPNGALLRGGPLLAEAAQALSAVERAVFAGELTATPPTGRARVQHVGAALADASLEPRLAFTTFDVVQDGDQEGLKLDYGQRLSRLQALFGAGKRVGVVTTVEGDGKQAAALYREWVGGQGFEGVVIRSEVGIVFKVKPLFSVDAVIIAYGTRVEQGAQVLREVTVALRRDDGTLQIIGPVGGGFSEEDRVAWLARLAKLEVPSSFRLANRDGALCKFVRPEIVVEIQCTDLLETDANDVPVSRMALSYAEGAGYQAAGEATVAALLFPRFLRERTDKAADVVGIGLTQLTSRLAIDPSEGFRAALPASEIVHRAVWVKGEEAVRKIAVIATHKQPYQGYAPFVVFGTDFSAGRAEPLKTSVKTASTRERADALVAAWVEENVKRGWNPYGVAAAEPPAKPRKARAKAEPKADAAEGATPAEAAPAADGAAEKPKKPRTRKPKAEEV